MSTIGVDTPRVDGPAKVSGTVQYAADIQLPGMLHAKVLRSIYPHARLVSVDTSAAERLPGVISCLTRDGLGDAKPYYGSVLKDQPIVAIDKVRYVGDPIAAVAALDRQTAEDALELIEVEYEPLPAVLDVDLALRPDAPVIHDRELEIASSFIDPDAFHFKQRSNLITTFHVEQGNVERAFAEADELFDSTYSCPTVQHGNMEPHSATATWDASGQLTVYTPCQNPSVVRDQLADMFGLRPGQVRIVVPYVGGAYGAKTHLRLEPLVAVLSRKAARPVQLTLTREEVFMTAVRHACVVRIRTGVKRDGTLVARQVESFFDTGAYAHTGPITSKNAGTVSAGPYRIPHQSLTAHCIYTNKPPAGPYRGFGVSQVAWAYEQQMDEIAHALGLDRLGIRLQNLVHEGDRIVTGETLSALDLEGPLREVARQIGDVDIARKPTQHYERGSRRPLVRGRGIACVIKTTMTPSTSAATVRLDSDGTATLFTSSVEMGQGARTSLAQIVAEELRLPVENVFVTLPDTDVTPYDQSTSSSRTIFMMGRAAQQAAGQVREQLLAMAGTALEVAPGDLELDGGDICVKGVPVRRVSIPDIFERTFGRPRGGCLSASVVNRAVGGLDRDTGRGKSSAFFFVGAAGAEVEVDPELGIVHVLRLVVATDVGKAINPRQVHLQNEGSMLMGLGTAIFEEMTFADGQPTNASLLHYMLPSIKDHPREFRSIIFERPHPEGPFGAKGAGEAAIPAIAPAIANAVADALGGTRLHSMPMLPHRVLAAIREREAARE